MPLSPHLVCGHPSEGLSRRCHHLRRMKSDRLPANQSISDRKDSYPQRRLSQLVKKCLHLFSLIIVEIRQSYILLLQPFKLPIVQQRITLHRLYLLFGIFPIQFFNLTDNLHKSAGDRPVLRLNPFVNPEYRRFASDPWRLKIYPNYRPGWNFLLRPSL